MHKSHRQRQYTLAKVLGSLGLWTVMGFWMPPGVQALPNYLTVFNTRYGTAATRLNTCAVCHTTATVPPGNTARNPYGLDFAAQPNHAVQVAQALQSIEPLNSDACGSSNGVEIGALTFPGLAIDEPGVATPPLADAGPDRDVDEGTLVTLNGSNSSDPNTPGPLMFDWRQTAGPTVTLANPTTAQPTFRAPAVDTDVVILEFEVTVTNCRLESDIARVSITVVDVLCPLQTVIEGALVTLDGSQCHSATETPLSFQWQQIAGPPVALSDNHVERPTFRAPAVNPLGALLRFALQVTDAQQRLVAMAIAEVQVLNDGTQDEDGDGVSDALEEGAPNNGDGNNDGMPDWDQDNVASLRDTGSGQYLTLVTPAGTHLVDVRSVENPSPGDVPPGATFPLNFLSFMMQGVTPGASTTLTILTPSGVEVNTYFKYGRTLALPFNHWYRFVFDNTTGAEVGTNMVVLHFVDGQRGDDDISANGTIVDIGALALQRVLLSDSGGGEGGGGASGGCAIGQVAQSDFTLIGGGLLLLMLLGWRRLTRRGAHRRSGVSEP